MITEKTKKEKAFCTEGGRHRLGNRCFACSRRPVFAYRAISSMGLGSGGVADYDTRIVIWENAAGRNICNGSKKRLPNNPYTQKRL